MLVVVIVSNLCETNKNYLLYNALLYGHIFVHFTLDCINFHAGLKEFTHAGRGDFQN